MTAESERVGTVAFSRLPSRGVLVGLSIGQLCCLAIALVVLLVGMYTAGGAGLVWTSPIWVGAAVIAWLPLAGRPVVDWLPVAVAWLLRRTTGATTHRRRVAGPVVVGELDLPGHRGGLRCLQRGPDQPAIVYDPVSGWLVAVARVTHESFVLLDPADQQRRVDGWARVLAGAGRSGRIARIQVLERTLPDSGEGLSRWWQTEGSPDSTSWAAATYQELIDAAGPAGETHRTTVSIALDPARAGGPIRAAGGGLAGATVVLEREMATLIRALASADLAPVDWLTPTDLADVLRATYDPAGHDRPSTASRPARHLERSGPVAVDEHVDAVRTDSGWHAVLWVAEWPRTAVSPAFLAPIILTAGVRRTFTLLCDPVPTATAHREIRRRRTEHVADAAQRARFGQIDDPTATAEYADVCQQEADLTAGHALVRYTGLLTVTATSRDALEAAVADVEHAAVQASCETRRLIGQQARAHVAAALPLCLTP